jgi:Na+-translocating ferredoxin:NAD+ oxidoreductase RnfD subunit
MDSGAGYVLGTIALLSLIGGGMLGWVYRNYRSKWRMYLIPTALAQLLIAVLFCMAIRHGLPWLVFMLVTTAAFYVGTKVHPRLN